MHFGQRFGQANHSIEEYYMGSVVRESMPLHLLAYIVWSESGMGVNISYKYKNCQYCSMS